MVGGKALDAGDMKQKTDFTKFVSMGSAVLLCLDNVFASSEQPASSAYTEYSLIESVHPYKEENYYDYEYGDGVDIPSNLPLIDLCPPILKGFISSVRKRVLMRMLLSISIFYHTF